MRLEAISLQNVRRFGEEGLVIEGLGPGLNVLTAPNEFGKSTLVDALRVALFVKDSSKEQKTVGSLRSRTVPGDPFVTLEFSTAEGLFRLRKLFAEGRKDSYTELRLPGGTALRGDEADARLKAILAADKPQAGPVGLLWLSQGDSLRGIVTTEKSGEKSGLTTEQAETVSSFLVQETTDAAGDDDVRTIIARARGELRKLETPGRATPTDALKRAIADVEAAEAEHAETSALVARGASLRAELRSREEALGNLDDPAEAARRRSERASAAKRAADASRLRSDIGHTKELMARDQETVGRLQSDAHTLRTSANELKSLVDAIGMAAETLAALDAEVSHTSRQRDESRDRRRDCQNKAASYRAGLRAWDLIDAAADREAEAKALDQRLTEALRLQETVAAKRPMASAPPIDLEALRKAERSFDKLQAQAAASAPRLSLEEGEGASVDGQVLAKGETVAVTGEGVITVGTTVLKLHRAGGEALQTALGRAQDELSRVLAAAGVRSVEEAAAKEAEREAASLEVRQLLRELSVLAPDGPEALKARLSELEAAPDIPEAPALGREDLETALREAEQDEARAASDEEQLSAKIDALSLRLGEARVTAETQKREASRLNNLLGPEDQRAEKEALLESRLVDLETAIGGRQHQLGLLAQALKEAERAEDDLRRLDETASNIEKKRLDLQTGIARIEGELSQIYAAGAEARLAELDDALALAVKRRDALELRRRALRLLLEHLEDEQEIRRQTVIAPVLAELEPMLEQVFGDATLHFDSEWNPEELRRPGQSLRVQDLSAGTREQIAVLTRLAFAKLMAKQGHPMPVVLDDALGYADDQRARRLFGVIRDVAEVTQVIVLSCHERLFSELGGQAIEPKPLA